MRAGVNVKTRTVCILLLYSHVFYNISDYEPLLFFFLLFACEFLLNWDAAQWLAGAYVTFAHCRTISASQPSAHNGRNLNSHTLKGSGIRTHT